MKRIADIAIKVLAVCGMMLMCAACQSDDVAVSLYDGETLAYDHPQNGAALTLPADWEKLLENEESVVFADAEDTVSLTLTRELAGYSYYSIDGLVEMAGEIVDGVLEQPETMAAAELHSPKDAVIFTGAGRLTDTAEDAPAAICEAVIISPLSAVRYHLVVVAEVDYYAANAELLREIYSSFHLNKTEDEIYESLSLTAEK